MSLLDACYHKDIESVKEELDKGVDINKGDNNGYTALIMAIRNRPIACALEKQYEAKKQEQIVSLLLEKGPDINARDNDGCTALMW